MYVQLSRLGVVVLGSVIVVGCSTEGSSTSAQRRVTGRHAGERRRRSTRTRSSLPISRAGSTTTWSCTTGWRSKPRRSRKPRIPRRSRHRRTCSAQKIREARKDAKPGEIFTPEIRQLFRRLMYPETKGPDGAETKAAIAEEKQELKDVKLRVNAAYPDNAPLMTVPPNILAALPKLPEDLEFRFVNRHMILLDVHANLIVDYVLNAIQ